HERGHARQYRRDVVTRARLAGSQSASRVWLWPPVNGGSILCSLNVKTARWWRAIVSFTHLAREGRMTVTIGRRELLAPLGGAALAWPLAASAQQGERVRRIVVLMNTAADETVFQIRVGAFLQGLALSGWTISRNVRIEIRWSGGKADDARRYAAELVALAPDVILAHGVSTVRPLLQATRTVPIVFPIASDPVGMGLNP